MRIHIKVVIVLLLLAPVAHSEVTFRKVVLTSKYFCDGINAGDVNRDGNPDIIAGPFWYEGPSFKKAHTIYEPVVHPTEPSPTDSMFSFVHDFDGDGWIDVMKLGRVHKHEAVWFHNPGKAKGMWKKHYVFERIRGESPTLVDIDGDKRKELVCHWENKWGFIQADKNATAPWKFHPVSTKRALNQFYHGTGVGDVDGDGLQDIILNDGWMQQPAEGDGNWTERKFRFGNKGGAQMFAYDVDGDGDNDVVTSLDAHGWGLAWFEQVKDGFNKHMIMGSRDEESKYGVAFSQPHAMECADVDGDGLKDIVVGKRRWAHGPKGDVEPNAAPVVYWFQLKRDSNGKVKFAPHLIDDTSGVGVQINVIDVTGDGRLDVLTASKLGSFLFVNQTK